MLSLLFTASPPQKSDVSEMLVPSLKRLLGVCRKYQKAKQDKAKELKDGVKTEEMKVDESKGDKEVRTSETSKDEGNKESDRHSADDDRTRPPPSKRRRSEETATSFESAVPSVCPSQGEEKKSTQETGECSKGRRVAQGTKTKLSGQLIRKIHSDYVDMLAKIIESVMSKVPK